MSVFEYLDETKLHLYFEDVADPPELQLPAPAIGCRNAPLSFGFHRRVNLYTETRPLVVIPVECLSLDELDLCRCFEADIQGFGQEIAIFVRDRISSFGTFKITELACEPKLDVHWYIPVSDFFLQDPNFHKRKHEIAIAPRQRRAVTLNQPVICFIWIDLDTLFCRDPPLCVLVPIIGVGEDALALCRAFVDNSTVHGDEMAAFVQLQAETHKAVRIEDLACRPGLQIHWIIQVSALFVNTAPNKRAKSLYFFIRCLSFERERHVAQS
jgi:hypothetical protein